MEHYSAHPALASEQLQRAEHTATAQTHHRRYNNSTGASDAAVSSGKSGFPRPSTPSKLKSSNKSAKTSITSITPTTLTTTPTTLTTTTTAVTAVLGSTATQFSTAATAPTQKTLPDRTNFDDNENRNRNQVNFADYEIDYDDDDNNKTKDCVNCASSLHTNHAVASIDEPDHLQHRFSRTATRQQFTHQTFSNHHTDMADDGCVSGLSSAVSSAAPSTTCSPLSTPTRLATSHFHHHSHEQHQPQQFCSQKSACPTGGGAVDTPHHHHHHHNHAHTSHTTASSTANGCKKLQKFDLRQGPSPYRQLLPIALCILSFATVFSILIVYMDTTEIRHQQFRLNMSRDCDYDVAQDDPKLIAFLREIHMRKYSMQFLKNRDATETSAAIVNGGGTEQHLNFSAHHDEITPKMAHYVADLVGGKMNGAVIQSLPGAFGQLMTAPWLAETLKWAGVIVEPEPRRYFTLRKQNAQRPRLQVVHACVSPNPYPKEVTIHNEESEVRINSLLDEETSWFNSRVKCFPLYTIMLACNRVEYDLLSLGVHGHELEILQTLPFDKIKIEVISIHLGPDDHEDLMHSGGNGNSGGGGGSTGVYIQTISKFLMGKSYKLQKRFGRNYFYQRINTTSRTRKKDILLLKTP